MYKLLLFTILLTIFSSNFIYTLPVPKSCIKNCKWCDFETGNCKLCNDGFFLYNSRDKNIDICAPCVTGCKKCIGGDFSECYQLLDGWRQTSKTEIEPCGLKGCKTCNFEENICRGCEPGYVGLLTEDGKGTVCKKCSQFNKCRTCQDDLDTC